jgi:hypothetical protein
VVGVVGVLVEVSVGATGVEAGVVGVAGAVGVVGVVAGPGLTRRIFLSYSAFERRAATTEPSGPPMLS